MNNDIYQYIASNNPQGCIDVCTRYGWDVRSEQELPSCMKHIVAEKGQNSFSEFLQLHPDREVIVELFGEKKEKCKDCIGNLKQYLNATGGQTQAANSALSTHQNIAGQTQTLMIGSILIISLALILKANS